MWVYRRDPGAAPKPQAPFPNSQDTGVDLWQVGFLNGPGDFTIVRLQTTERDAARVVHYLNGGMPQEWPPHDP